MSFNLNYVTQGLDFTAFGQGVAQGLQQAAANKRRQEELARQDLKEFESKFDLDKVLDKDSGAIIQKFEELKPLQLEYTRLNNSNAKPSKLQELKSKIESIKGNISNIYSESKANASLYKEYKDFGDMMTRSGFDLPDDYISTMQVLAKEPSSNIDKTKLKLPNQFSFEASSEELSNLDKTIKAGAKADKITETAGKKYDVTLEGGDKVSVTEDVIYKMAKPNAVYNLVEGSMDTNKRIKNKAIKEKTAIVSNFNLPDNNPLLSDEENIQNAIKKKVAQKAFEDIKLIASQIGDAGLKIEKPEDIPASLALAYNRNYFNKEQVATSLNREELLDRLKSMDKQKQWKFREKSLNMLQQKLNMAKVNQAIGIGNFLKFGGYEMAPWMADFIDATPYDFRTQLDASRKAYKDMRGSDGGGIIINPNTKK